MRALAFIAVAALAACQPPAPADPPEPAAEEQAPIEVSMTSWTCDDGATLSVGYIVEDNIKIVLPDGRTLILPQVEAASGARYADAAHEFWSKSDEAMFTDIAAKKTATCRAAE